MDKEEVKPKVSSAKPKVKKQLSEAQLAQLAKAREKANAVRKSNAEAKRKAKELQELNKQAEQAEVEEKLNAIKTKVKSKVGNKPKVRSPILWWA